MNCVSDATPYSCWASSKKTILILIFLSDIFEEKPIRIKAEKTIFMASSETHIPESIFDSKADQLSRL